MIILFNAYWELFPAIRYIFLWSRLKKRNHKKDTTVIGAKKHRYHNTQFLK